MSRNHLPLVYYPHACTFGMFHILYGSFSGFHLQLSLVWHVLAFLLMAVLFKHIDDTGHMGYFYLLTVMINTAVNIQVCMYILNSLEAAFIDYMATRNREEEVLQ